MRRAVRVRLEGAEARLLQTWSADPKDRCKRATRARIVLLAAQGTTNQAIARELGVHAETVALWRRRFVANRVEGIRMDAPRSSARRRARRLWEQIARAPRTEPTSGGREWTTRSLAKHFHVSHMTVQRARQARAAWEQHPRSMPFDPSGAIAVDPGELDGIFLHPPCRAAVLEFDPRPRTDAAVPKEGRAVVDPGHAAPGPTLADLYRSWKTSSTHRHRDVSSVADLLVLLRSIEARAVEGSAFTVVFQGFSRASEQRLYRWVRSHGRFRATKVPPRTTWLRTVERCLEAGGSLPPSSPAPAGGRPLAESLARHLRANPAAPTPFVWMSPALTWGDGGSSSGAPSL